jgi:hypothetical protein
VVDPYEFLRTADTCSAVQPNGDFIYKDSDHLSASFVRDHAEFIDRVLEPWRWVNLRSLFRSGPLTPLLRGSRICGSDPIP